MAETHKRCGATHPRLSDDNACREPAGHAGPHMTHDSMGRPEWTWEPGAEWVEVATAVPDPRFRDQLAEEPAWIAAFYQWAKTDKSPGSYSAAFAAGYRAALAAPVAQAGEGR